MNQVNQSIGIDVSKDAIMCCMGTLESGQHCFSKSKSFPNTPKGFEVLLEWSTPGKTSAVFVMEATGVYYENLAYWLDSQGYQLSVLLPNKMKHYAKSLNVKTKTDAVDAQVLSRVGLERTLHYWHMPSAMMREIKFLSREYRETKAKLVVIKNQLHAKKHSFACPLSVEKRLIGQMALLETQLLEIESELRAAAISDPQFYDRVTRLNTIPGISFITIITILAETNAFALIKNAKQLASYAGLDVEHRQSGAKEGKTKISKKGNRFIRNALYMPALCATKHNPHMKPFYTRLCERKPAKKVAVTAVARKLLVLTFTLWKNNQEFIENYTEESRKALKPAYTG